MPAIFNKINACVIIISMNDFDHYDLDGHALRLFLAVLDTGSVTGAADELSVTQSAVSHALQKLRAIVRDPLFVKSGRGIVATAHAQSLAPRARDLLANMQDFSRGAHFHPATADLSLVIAANDLQRDLLLPGFSLALEGAVRRLSLRIVPSDAPTADILRDGTCDLLITPFPPEGADILQRNLFRDEYVCFYDPACRAPPASKAEYLAARHVTVVYPDRTKLVFDTAMEKAGFSRDFATAPVPGRPKGADLAMSLVWRRRDAQDPAMTFIRNLMFRQAREAVQTARAATA